MNNLGERIAYYRKKKGMSQEKLAEALDISRQAVSKWESNTGRPSTENLLRLAELFGVSLGELLPAGTNVMEHGTQARQTDKASSRESISPATTPSTEAASVFCFLSAAVVVLYMVIGFLRQSLDGEIAVMMAVIALMMALPVHIYFAGAIKTGDFAGIAGFDPDVEYHVPEIRRLLMRIDKHVTLASFIYVVLIFIISGLPAGMTGGGDENLLPAILMILYIVDFIVSILFMNHQSRNRIYVHEADLRRAKAGMVSTIVFLVMVFGLVAETGILFTFRQIENNTPRALTACGYILTACVLLTVGLLREQHRLKKTKAQDLSYRPGMLFVICVLLAAVCMAVMAVVL